MDHFDFSDDNQFRNLIVWLEDQKIRHYKIEDRAGLRNTAAGPEWIKALEKVSIFYKLLRAFCYIPFIVYLSSCGTRKL